MTNDGGARALREQAIKWHLRIAEGTGADWDAFADWVAEHPDHLLAYEEIEAVDDDARAALLNLPANAISAANDDAPPSLRRWWYGGAAASIALAVGLGPTLMQNDDRYEIMTLPGQRQQVKLGSGDRIILNGDTRIALDRSRPRFAALEKGEAVFSVRHDPAAPFEVQVGEGQIRDVGTVFNVARGSDGVRVAVAEGTVIYNPHREAVRLASGDALHDPVGKGAFIRSRLDPETVGTWRAGRLTYAGVPLRLVAIDLGRATGERVRVAPGLAGQRFSGTIRIDTDHQRLFDDLTARLGVLASRDRGGWMIAPHRHVAR